jgi:ABC-type Fe3+ transport system permease subunit
VEVDGRRVLLLYLLLLFMVGFHGSENKLLQAGGWGRDLVFRRERTTMEGKSSVVVTCVCMSTLTGLIAAVLTRLCGLCIDDATCE